MIDELLKPFQKFGVHLGLERIEQLLADLGNPQDRVPFIHVGGTNGKGSVCAYLAAVLTEAGYRVGRYTSPHLVDWTERICLNEEPIATATLAETIKQVQRAINPDLEPTLFEVVTAAAWLYFAQEKVDVAVMEVGLGGRLDATNVGDRPLVSVITSISREHWQNLGFTVAAIAREKAGIIKPECPVVVGNLPPEPQAVISDRISELNCPAVWIEKAQALPQKQTPWAEYGGIEYPLPLLGEVQLNNSACAIASLQILRQKGWNIPLEAIQKGMAKTRWLGRMQWTTWQGKPLLIDGAHNPAAAKALRQYVDTLPNPVTWIMGILSTKDHADIFEALLRKGDRLYLVPVPDHSSADPETLADLAQSVCTDLDHCQVFEELFIALETVFANQKDNRPVILCGSLYLVGYFLQHNENSSTERV